jgi:lipopolysaccharide transport system permease protein
MDKTINSKYHEIRPKRGWFDWNLREVWNYRDLLYLLVRRDIVTVYKQTVLGILWFIIPPVLNTITYFIIFGLIAKLPTDGVPPILFYLCGLLPWSFFSDSVNRTSVTLRANAGMFGKVYFPRVIVPLSNVLSALAKFMIQLIVLLLTVGYYTFSQKLVSPAWDALWILGPLLAILALAGLALGLIISSLTTKYRDFIAMVPFALQLMMYCTPVLFTYESVPSALRWVFKINPLSPAINAFRYLFTGTGAISWSGLAYFSICSIILAIIGLMVFTKTEKSFMDTV